MSAKTYLCRRFRVAGAFEFSCDLSDPASNILVRWADAADDDGPWSPVPFQVLGRNKATIERLIVDYFA